MQYVSNEIGTHEVGGISTHEEDQIHKKLLQCLILATVSELKKYNQQKQNGFL